MSSRSSAASALPILNSRYTRRDYAAAIPSPDSQVGSITGKYQPEIFTYYKSVSEAGNLVIAKQKNILVSPKFIIAYIVVISLLLFTAIRVYQRGLFPSTVIAPTSTSAVVPSPDFSSSSASSFRFPASLGYTSYTCFPSDDVSVCLVRLSDGSTQFVHSVRMPGGLIFDNGRIFLPGAVHSKERGLMP